MRIASSSSRVLSRPLLRSCTRATVQRSGRLSFTRWLSSKSEEADVGGVRKLDLEPERVESEDNESGIDLRGPYTLLNQNVRGLEVSPTVATNDLQRKMRAEGKHVYSMGFGQSPFPVPNAMVDAMRANARQKDYLPARGLPALRAAVADRHNRFRVKDSRYNVTEEDVFIAPGSKEAMFVLQTAYYGELLLPSPSWVSYEPQARILGRSCRWIHTSASDGWKLTAEALAEELDYDHRRPRVLILNSPSNPAGTAYTAQELQGIATHCRRHGVIVISDEIYASTCFGSELPVSLATLYPEGTVVSTGISKWAGAGGWRMGCLIFPRNLRWLMDAMAAVASETFTCVSAPIQYGAIPAFADFESSEMQHYLKTSRKMLCALGNYSTRELRKTGATVVSPVGGFYVFPDFTPVTTEVERMRDEWFAQCQANGKSVRPSQFNGVRFAHHLMERSHVSGLSGTHFGRPTHEYTMRLSFVDFDGKGVLDAASEMPEDPLSPEMEKFCSKYAPRVIEAVDVLRDYFTSGRIML